MMTANTHTPESASDTPHVEDYLPHPATTEKTQAAVDGQQDNEERYNTLYDQLIRLQADFDNFRKRVEAEKLDLHKYGAQRTLSSLLPILDNLDRGTASLNEQSDPKLLYQSIQLLQTQLLEGLANQGLKKIDVTGQEFDPYIHEAVMREHHATLAENKIINELQAGYTLHDRVLRPAMVSVSAGLADHTESSDTNNPFQG